MSFYVYRVTNLITQIHYIGSRGCIGSPYQDIGFKYFTSQKILAKELRTHPEQFKIKIVRVCPSRADAFILEERYQRRVGIPHNTKFSNRVLAGRLPCTAPKSSEHRAKISAAHKGTKKPWAAFRSDATRQKMSATLKAFIASHPGCRTGINNPATGRPRPDLISRNRRGLSITSRNKLHESITGRKLHINSTGQRRLFKPHTAPDGWVLTSPKTAQERDRKHQAKKKTSSLKVVNATGLGNTLTSLMNA